MEGFKAKQVKLSEFEVLNTLGTGTDNVVQRRAKIDLIAERR